MIENIKNEYDIVIIGAGIIGTCIAYYLSKYNLSILQLEKNPYIADETTAGNSGVIHGGFDALETKIEAKLNIEGNKIWRNFIFKHLDFPRKKIDSLVIAFNKEEMKHVDILYKRGLTNGVLKEDMEIIDAKKLVELEPNVNPEAIGALLCTSSWAIDPIMASRAFVGAAKLNGLELRKNSEVTNIAKNENNSFEIEINNKETINAKTIINVAGHYADNINDIAGHKSEFKLTTRRGEYRILSKSEINKVRNICFKVPTIHGKGVIVSPMLDGRVLVGPTAENDIPKDETRLITRKMYSEIKKIGNEIIPTIDLSKTEKSISGSRPIDVKSDDFIIATSKYDKNFINIAGMQSPAISSAPAIAEMVEKILEEETKQKLKLKENYELDYSIIW
ncbi:MAG: type 2 glycerol-3-phosphate oxidase [Mycoplasma sp.]|nr:type 2 glycerol-3-phosphate oxidase [Mycoplasma sp.]